MLARYPYNLVHLSARVSAVAAMAAVLLAAPTAYGFGFKDVAKNVVGDLEAMAGEDPRNREEKSLLRRKLEWEADKAVGEVKNKAADRIEAAALKGGKKVWEKLEGTKTFGPAARKMAARYGAAVAHGTRLGRARWTGSRRVGNRNRDRGRDRASRGCEDRQLFRGQMGGGAGATRPGDSPSSAAGRSEAGAQGRPLECPRRGRGDAHVAGGSGTAGEGAGGSVERRCVGVERGGGRPVGAGAVPAHPPSPGISVGDG